MVNKDLDEHKEIIIRLNKRLYYLIIGLLAEKNLYNKKEIVEILEKEIK